ncbi:hypothetical protein M1D68_14940 [Pseudomonas sp. R4-84]
MSSQLESALRHYDVSKPKLEIIVCLLSMLIFAGQGGFTKVLVQDLPIAQLVMVRYWVFRLLPSVMAFITDAYEWRVETSTLFSRSSVR